MGTCLNWSEDCDTRGSVLIEFIRCDPGVRIFDSQLVLSLSLSLRNRGLKIRCDYSALGLQNNTHPPLRTPSLDKKTHPGCYCLFKWSHCDHGVKSLCPGFEVVIIAGSIPREVLALIDIQITKLLGSMLTRYRTDVHASILLRDVIALANNSRRRRTDIHPTPSNDTFAH